MKNGIFGVPTREIGGELSLQNLLPQGNSSLGSIPINNEKLLLEGNSSLGSNPIRHCANLFFLKFCLVFFNLFFFFSGFAC